MGSVCERTPVSLNEVFHASLCPFVSDPVAMTSSLNSFTESIEGKRLPAFDNPALTRVCDTCGEVISDGDRVGLYFASPIFRNPELSDMAFLRLHCSGCSKIGIRASATGFMELFCRATYDAETEIVTGVELHDASVLDAGVPYDPIDVMQALAGDVLDVVDEFVERDELAAPQDVVFHLHTLGIDILGLIDEDTGEITVSKHDRELYLTEVLKTLQGADDEEILKHVEDKYGET